MKRAISVFFIAFSASVLVHAEPVDPVLFDERVRLAKEAESDEQLKAYPHALVKQSRRHFARTMRSCKAVSAKPKAKAFVVVADINAEGKAEAVEVNPDNAVARCFAARFSSATYPKPPAYAGRNGFPVTIKVRVTP